MDLFLSALYAEISSGIEFSNLTLSISKYGSLNLTLGKS